MEKVLYLDIKDKELCKYLFAYKRGEYENLDTQCFPFSFDSEFPDIAIDEKTRVYISLPISLLNFRVIELPFSEKEKLEEILKFELEGKILYDINDIIFDTVVIEKLDNKYNVLVTYIAKQNLQSILRRLNSKGIDPYCVTSVEIRYIINEFSIDKILKPISLKNEDRINLAKKDLKSPIINLRKDEFIFKKGIEKQKKIVRITILLLILLFSLNFSNFLVNFISLKKEANLIKNDIRKMYQTIFPHEKNIFNEIYQISSHIKELEGKEDVYLGISPLKILLDLSRINMNGLIINEIVADKINIVIKGEAPSLSVIQEYRDKLSEIYSNVNISESKELVNRKIGFTIIIREKTA